MKGMSGTGGRSNAFRCCQNTDEIGIKRPQGFVGKSLRRAIRAAVWLDNHWIGEVIGVVSLFALLWMMLFAAAVFG